jgi:DNA invertase Pin-like site-specific DNA recombinase
VSIIGGSNIAQSVAGLSQAERAEVREKQRAEAAKAKPRNREGDAVIVNTEAAEAIRNLKGNGEEEAQEDRQQKAGYSPTGTAPTDPAARPHLDIQG